jgi:hypothetical protein
MTPSLPRKGKYSIIKEKTRDKLRKGKPSKLDSYLILVLLIACFINVYEIT